MGFFCLAEGKRVMTTRTNNLDYAEIQPTVTIGGKACDISYAGRAPGYPALDQINCSVPAGLSGGPQ